MEPEVSKITTTRFKYVRDDPANEKLQRVRQYNSYYEALPKKNAQRKRRRQEKKRGIRSMSVLQGTDIHSLQRSLITPHSRKSIRFILRIVAPAAHPTLSSVQRNKPLKASVQAGSLVTSTW